MTRIQEQGTLGRRVSKGRGREWRKTSMETSRRRKRVSGVVECVDELEGEMMVYRELCRARDSEIDQW